MCERAIGSHPWISRMLTSTSLFGRRTGSFSALPLWGWRTSTLCLPFGYSLAPHTFSKCVETALEPLRRQGKRILFYLDDLLILSNSEETARRDTMLVINHLSFLGFAINWEKSSPLPSQQTVYLGLCLDSATMTAMLSPPRRDAILSCRRSLVFAFAET